MKISRVASESLVPEWFEEAGSQMVQSEIASPEEVERYSILSADEVTDEILVRERDEIEKCAQSGSLYHYNSTWSDSTRQSLKEYAIVCGMDMSKFRGVHPDELQERIATSQSEPEVEEPARRRVTAMQHDPFHIDERSDDSHMRRANWQDVSRQLSLKDKPSMMSGAVKPLRGGENYFENSDVDLATNQNSISNPDAIEQLAESEVEDTGARLKREREEKESAKTQRHAEWQQEVIDAMEHKDEIPSGKVFPTEVMNAQPGIRGEGPFNFDTIPEQSSGEKLAEANRERKAAIRGEEKEKHEFEVQRNSTRNISDNFGEELKKYLK